MENVENTGFVHTFGPASRTEASTSLEANANTLQSAQKDKKMCEQDLCKDSTALIDRTKGMNQDAIFFGDDSILYLD